MTGVVLATLAACIAFVLWLLNAVGIVSGNSWIDITWSWVIAGLMGGAWWMAYTNDFAVSLGVFVYVVLTGLRTGMFFGSR